MVKNNNILNMTGKVFGALILVAVLFGFVLKSGCSKYIPLKMP